MDDPRKKCQNDHQNLNESIVRTLSLRTDNIHQLTYYIEFPARLSQSTLGRYDPRDLLFRPYVSSIGVQERHSLFMSKLFLSVVGFSIFVPSVLPHDFLHMSREPSHRSLSTSLYAPPSKYVVSRAFFDGSEIVTISPSHLPLEIFNKRAINQHNSYNSRQPGEASRVHHGFVYCIHHDGQSVSRQQPLCCLYVCASQYTTVRAQHHPSRCTSLHMTASYNKVFVAGGSRGVGRAIVDRLVDMGTPVVALVRNEEAANELNALEGVTAVIGDAFDYKSVEGAMDGCDAAITTLGGAVTDDGKRVDYAGNSNVIEAAGILGVTRVVLVTSVGCGSSKDAAPPAVFEALKEVLAAKEKAENVLIKYYTNMNWTIIRPGGLKSEPATGEAILTEDKMAIGTIHREDVADLVTKALVSENTERKVLSAIDPSIASATNADGRVVDAFALA